MSLRVTLCGLPLDNPVIPASGTFGYGAEFAALYDINILGTFSFKGTTRQPRFGNPTPRIAECPAGMLNAVGLQNPGIDHVLAYELPQMKQYFHKPVMANVSGFSVEDYVEVCRRLDGEEQVGWLEVNISCPNVHGGGMSFGTDPASAAEVTRAVKAVTDKPVIVKLSPNVTDIAAIARASSTRFWGCGWIWPGGSPSWPIPQGACPARPFSPWRCGWYTRSMKRYPFPLWAWGASPAPEM